MGLFSGTSSEVKQEIINKLSLDVSNTVENAVNQSCNTNSKTGNEIILENLKNIDNLVVLQTAVGKNQCELISMVTSLLDQNVKTEIIQDILSKSVAKGGFDLTGTDSKIDQYVSSNIDMNASQKTLNDIRAECFMQNINKNKLTIRNSSDINNININQSTQKLENCIIDQVNEIAQKQGVEAFQKTKASATAEATGSILGSIGSGSIVFVALFVCILMVFKSGGSKGPSKFAIFMLILCIIILIILGVLYKIYYYDKKCKFPPQPSPDFPGSDFIRDYTQCLSKE